MPQRAVSATDNKVPKKSRHRGHNEGTIVQREDGRWTAVIHLGYAVGKDGKRRRQRKYFYGKTRREVAMQLNAALAKQREGLPVSFERQTVAQFMDRWLKDVVKATVRPSTYASYETYVRVHIKPSLGHHQLAKLDPQHVQAFLNEKLASGLSPRSVQYIRAILRRALGQALKWGHVARNVATLVDPPRSKRPEIHPLTPAQVRTFLEAIKGNRLEALYIVAISLGLRQGEALGLRWQDVDLDAGTLRVRYAMQKIDGVPTFVEPKTERSRRAIALPAVTVTALRMHKIRQLEERLIADGRWQDWSLVFSSTIGTPLDASNVTHQLQSTLKAADLPRQRFHDLRHCCATLLLSQGVSPRTIMEILGHSQISLTMNTYAHVMPELKRDAADLMERILTVGA